MIRTWILVLAVVVSVWMVGSPEQANCKDRKPADVRYWIVGKWRNDKLNFGDFGEWTGAKQIELVVTSQNKIGLFLIFADGKRTRAGDSEPSILDDGTLFFGPVGSGLLFKY